MSRITDFRLAVQSQLATDLEIPFKSGMIEGPFLNTTLGSCWAARVAEMSGRVDVEQIELRVRVFTKFVQQVDEEHPFDPTPLEAIVEKIQESVQAHQTGLGAWYQRMTSAQIDPATQGVECAIVGWLNNPGVSGG